MPDKYEKDMTVLMKAAAEVKVNSKKLKRYVITQRKASEHAMIAVSLSNKLTKKRVNPFKPQYPHTNSPN